MTPNYFYNLCKTLFSTIYVPTKKVKKKSNEGIKKWR